MKYLFYILIAVLAFNAVETAFPKIAQQEAIVLEKRFIQGQPSLLSSARSNDRYMVTFRLPHDDYADVYVSAKVYYSLDVSEKVVVGRSVSRITSRKKRIEWIGGK